MNKLTLLLPVFALSLAAATQAYSQSATPQARQPKRVIPKPEIPDDDVMLRISATGETLRVGDLTRGSKVRKAPKADEQTSSLREDFDKFTGGSETTPDRNHRFAGTIPAEYTNVEGWQAMSAYMAGGSCYLQDGYIQTPQVNLSKDDGNFTVKFRAKSFYQGESAYIYLYHSTNGNFDWDNNTKEIEVTDEYAEYTYTFNGGSATSALRFDMTYGGEVLIDFIDILQSGEGLPSPTLNAPSDITQTGFTASWTPVPGAEKYELNLYHKVEDPDNPVAEVLVEDFSDLEIIDDKFCAVGTSSKGDEGYVLMGTKPGFEIGFGKSGTYRHYYSDSKYYQSAPYAGCIDGDLDYFYTPENNEKYVSNLNFWVKSEVLDENDMLWILFNLDTSGDNTTSETIYSYRLTDYYEDVTSDEGAIFEIPYDYIPEGTNKVYVQWGGADIAPAQGYLAIDDITVTYGVNPLVLPEYDYEGLEVTGTSYTFTDLDADGTYYYTVTAVDAAGNRSTPSPEQSVVLTFYSLDTPVAHEITDPLVEVGNDGVYYESFKTNWEQVDNADGYEISIDIVHEALRDEVYTLDDEDFSGIPSNADPTDPDTYNTARLDLSTYCNRVGWAASLPVLATSMIGGQNGVFSPQFDLSNGDGTYSVDVTFYGSVGDVITVEAYDYSGAANNETQTYTLTSASEDVSFEFSNGSSAVGFTFTSTGYYVMLDNFTLAQALNAGDETRMTYFSARQNGQFGSAITYVVNRQEGDFYYYKVRAFATNAAGREIVSPYSNEVFIDLGEVPDVAVDDVMAANAAKAYVSAGELVVEVSAEAEVEVFTTAGVKVATFDAVPGTNRIALPEGGVYVVKVESEVFKVVK